MSSPMKPKGSMSKSEPFQVKYSRSNIFIAEAISSPPSALVSPVGNLYK
uniref:Uncharacterized protein n=1 Tax=Arundo donax TaxID=35708 RepID=A0A0A9AFA3_ARUDO